jgi:hypothetical protein
VGCNTVCVTAYFRIFRWNTEPSYSRVDGTWTPLVGTLGWLLASSVGWFVVWLISLLVACLISWLVGRVVS